MTEARKDRRWLIEPREMTAKDKNNWFIKERRPFICQICGKDLVVGKKWGCMMTNFGKHHGGNPFVGECCMDLSYEVRLKIWDENLVVEKQTHQIAYYRIINQIMIAQFSEQPPKEFEDCFNKNFKEILA